MKSRPPAEAPARGRPPAAGGARPAPARPSLRFRTATRLRGGPPFVRGAGRSRLQGESQAGQEDRPRGRQPRRRDHVRGRGPRRRGGGPGGALRGARGPAPQQDDRRHGAFQGGCLHREHHELAPGPAARPDGVQTGNRPPTEAEMAHCLPYLRAQIEIVNPGSSSRSARRPRRACSGPGASGPWARSAGGGTISAGRPLMVTYHPSYILRNPTNRTKRLIWEDLLKVMERANLADFREAARILPLMTMRLKPKPPLAPARASAAACAQGARGRRVRLRGAALPGEDAGRQALRAGPGQRSRRRS